MVARPSPLTGSGHLGMGAISHLPSMLGKLMHLFISSQLPSMYMEPTSEKKAVPGAVSAK